MSPIVKVAAIGNGVKRYTEIVIAKGGAIPAGVLVTRVLTGSFSTEATVDFNEYELIDMATQKPVPWNTWDVQHYERLGIYPKALAMNEGARLTLIAQLLLVHEEAKKQA